MSVTIHTEDFSERILEEILPLGQKCWDESTKDKGETCIYHGERDFDIEPNVEEYRKLAAIGSLIIVALRDGEALKGVVAGFMYKSLHHNKVLCGIGDTIYVEPEYRSYTGPLIERFLKELKDRKVEIIGWPVTLKGPIYKLLIARGFVGDEIVMEKRLYMKSKEGELKCA